VQPANAFRVANERGEKKMGESKPRTYVDYAGRFPKDVQRILQQIRETIKAAAPQAEEAISYGMPAFRLGGILVWFGAHEHHIGFYPGASGIAAFKGELARYKHAKGSVQFPIDEPLPIALITRMVKLRVKERLAKE
jgi:uncharacterized protein YdhG (YjbR/CyaY superfamily)